MEGASQENLMGNSLPCAARGWYYQKDSKKEEFPAEEPCWQAEWVIKGIELRFLI